MLAEPRPWQPRANLRRRRAVLAEHAARQGDPSPGGTRSVPVMTAYRQEALACAAALRAGPLRPARPDAHCPQGCRHPEAGRVRLVRKGVRGVYALSPEGTAALARWGVSADRDGGSADADLP